MLAQALDRHTGITWRKGRTLSSASLAIPLSRVASRPLRCIAAASRTASVIWRYPCKRADICSGRLDHGSVEGPERVHPQPPDLSQKRDGLERRNIVPDHRRTARHADESSFGQRTGCPALIPLLREPRSRRFVVHVVGPCQGNQDVDVQQRCQGHSSSDLYTSSLVIGSASGSTRNTGSSSPAGRPPRKPRRASSDSALPRLLPLRSASARATASTSSSMVSVVRMITSSHQRIRPVKRERNFLRGLCRCPDLFQDTSMEGRRYRPR